MIDERKFNKVIANSRQNPLEEKMVELSLALSGAMERIEVLEEVYTNTKKIEEKINNIIEEISSALAESKTSQIIEDETPIKTKDIIHVPFCSTTAGSTIGEVTTSTIHVNNKDVEMFDIAKASTAEKKKEKKPLSEATKAKRKEKLKAKKAAKKANLIN